MKLASCTEMDDLVVTFWKVVAYEQNWNGKCVNIYWLSDMSFWYATDHCYISEVYCSTMN